MKISKNIMVAIVAAVATVGAMNASSYFDRAAEKMRGYKQQAKDLYNRGSEKVQGLYETADKGLDKFRTGMEKVGGTIQGLHRQYSPEDIEEMTKDMTPTQKEAYLKSSGIVSKGRDLYGKADTTVRDLGRGGKKLAGKAYESYQKRFGTPTLPKGASQDELENMDEMAKEAERLGLGYEQGGGESRSEEQ